MVCADVHQDFFPNTGERLGQFIREAEEKKVDFIIQLGDFCRPGEENEDFMAVWKNYHGPRFHVLGNHDMDKCSKSDVLDFWGVDSTKSYYSFDVGSYHFIVLDPNNIFENGGYTPFSNGNYSSEGKNINYLTPEQLSWLKEDLAKTSKHTIIFSHQPLQVISNKGDLVKIIEETSGNPKKILAWFSGHNHSNWQIEEYSIHHIQVNSMCFKYVGDKFIHETGFPDEVESHYPLLKKMIPYKDALYCMVVLDPQKKEIRIDGKVSDFIPPGPEELGYSKTGIAGFSTSVDSRLIQY